VQLRKTIILTQDYATVSHAGKCCDQPSRPFPAGDAGSAGAKAERRPTRRRNKDKTAARDRNVRPMRGAENCGIVASLDRKRNG
jgi:hypothetical protein